MKVYFFAAEFTLRTVDSWISCKGGRVVTMYSFEDDY